MQFGSAPTNVIGVGELQIVQTRQIVGLLLTFSKSNGWTSIHPESAALAPVAKFTHAGRTVALELGSLGIGYHLRLLAEGAAKAHQSSRYYSAPRVYFVTGFSCFESRVLLKTESGYLRDTGVTWFTLANP